MDDLSTKGLVSPTSMAQTDSLPAGLLRLDQIAPQRLSWIWYPRLPAGCLSLLVGHPDRGKSLLACTIASRVSVAQAWPDGQPCPEGNVLFLESEDGLAETVLPRLQAAGANLTKIFSWSARNIAKLATVVPQLAPRLIVLSPLNTYLPRINTWVDQDVRHVLQPLADFAETTGAAILGIIHPPKAKQALPIHTVIGSVAFGAVARSILTVERTDQRLYLLESAKSNLTAFVAPIGFSIRPWSEDKTVAQLVWEPVPAHVSLLPANEESNALQEACEYLQMALAHGPIPTTAIKTGAEANGIAVRMVKEARRVLRVKATQVFKADRSHWELSLPPSFPTGANKSHGP